MRIHNPLVPLLLNALLLIAPIAAQTPGLTGTDGMTHPGREGGANGPGSLPLSGKESISLFSGKLSFNIPLLTIGGRGSSGYTMNLRLQQQWQMFQENDTSITPNEYKLLPSPTWWEPVEVGYGPGVLTLRSGGFGHGNYANCASQATSVLSRLTFVTPDGSEHSFKDAANDGKPSTVTFSASCVAQNLLNRGRIFKTFDGTAMTFISDSDIHDVTMTDGGFENREMFGFLFLADGTRYRIARGVVDWISDRNGNVTSFTYETTAGCSKCRVTEVRDPLKRKITIAYGTLTDLITYRGAQGVPRTITVNRGNPYATNCVANPDLLYRAYVPRKLSHNQQPSLFGGPDVKFLDYCYSDLVVSNLVLANGDSYAFQYNEYSELAKVTLPTGGGYLYEHEGGVGGGSYVGTFIYRRLKSRKEFTGHSGINENISGTTTFGYIFTAGGPQSTVTVTRKQGDNGVGLDQVTHYFRGTPQPVGSASPISYSYSDEAQEYFTEIKDLPTNRILKSFAHTHAQRTPVQWWVTPVAQRIQQDKEPANDIRVTQTTTTADPGASQKLYRQIFFYDDYNNRTSTYSYDFDFWTLLRYTQTTYLTSYAGRDYDSLANYNPAPANIADRVANVYHIRSVPRQVSVFKDNGCEVSRELYDFDQAAPLDRGNATQRLNSVDPGLYGSVDPYGTGFLGRANPTLVTRSLSYSQSNAGGCVGAAGVGVGRVYDILGNVTSITNPRTFATTFDYTDNFAGDVTDKGAQNTWAFVKDQTNALSHKTTIAYDYSLGLPTTRTDPHQQSTAFNTGFTYDTLGRLSVVTLADGGGLQYFYDAPNGLVTTSLKRTASANIQSSTVFDGLGRPCESRLNEGATVIRTRTEYDGVGRALRASNPQRLSTLPGRCVAGTGEAFTNQEYDALDRVVRTVASDGSASTTQFLGEKTTLTDADLKKRDLLTDALGRLSQVVEDPGGALNYATYYRYDGIDNLAGVCPGQPFDASGNCASTRGRRFRYDSLGRLRHLSYPEAGGNTMTLGDVGGYLYDANGNVASKFDARYFTSYTYDALDRLTNKTFFLASNGAQTSTHSYCYDDASSCGGAAVANSKGRLISAANGIGSTRYNNYDLVGRVTSSTQVIAGPGGGTFPFSNYSYDLAGNLTSITYPSGRVVQTAYDSAGRVSSVSNPANQTRFAEVASYTEHGAIQVLKLGGLLTGVEAANEVWAYNNRLQPIETRLRTGGSALNLSRLEYFYCSAQLLSCTNNNGNLRSQRISNEGVGSEPTWTTLQQYGYDALNRLTTFTDGTAAETNNYDPWGNRWATVSGLTPSPLTPGDVSWFNPGNNRISNLGYDEVGNQTQVNPYTLTYDGEGHVTSVASTSNGSAAYAYDADGRRVTKTIGTNVTAFVYDAFGHLAAEYGPSTGTAGLQFQMADHLGSTRVVTDAAGAVIRRHDYRPFGEDLTGVSGRSTKYGNTLNVLRFTGKERDAETGLDYFGARYMSSAQGRFTSPDALFADQHADSPQSWNMYSYVRNRPFSFVDDTGTQIQKPVPGASGYTYRGDLTNPHDNPNFHIFNRKGTEIGRISVQEALTGRVLDSGNQETALKLVTEEYAGYTVPNGVRDGIESVVQKRGIQPRFAAGGGSFSGLTVRGLGVLSMLSVFTGALADYKQAQASGVFTTIFGENKILDPTRAAQSLGAGAVIQYTDKSGKSQLYTVYNGQFVRGGCDQKRENCGISNPSEGSFSTVHFQ